jgi:peptide/nickel transport system ATP-binding protein
MSTELLKSTSFSAIEASHLSVGYRATPRGELVNVVHDVSFTLERGQTLALVGQSGSGKSTIAQAVAGLLPTAGAIAGGHVRLDGVDVTRFTDRQWHPLRGTTIGYVPQDPLSSLDPLGRIGAQLAQALRVHKVVPKSEIPAQVIRLLEHVGIRNAAERVRSYPHELSGGQQQRVLIATAIAANPSILVADEPTSALDVTVQKTILDLLAQFQEELGLAILFITHDLALAKDRSDTVAVLNHGELKEYGPALEVLAAPKDPYTVRLLSDAPALSPDKYVDRIRPTVVAAEPAITITDLSKTFGSARRATAPALDGVSLTVEAGSIHALVGESGSGKTTLARIAAGLTGFDSGAVLLGSRALDQRPSTTNHHARQLQLVYQNPLSAVDPRYSVGQIIEEPLLIHGVGDRASRTQAVEQILDRVSLPQTVIGRKPHEISGGQRQRVAVARALVLAPLVLVLDEPTSALDVTVQAQIIDLLLDLQAEEGLSYLFISHDLSLVRQIADDVTVLQQGRVVDQGPVAQIFDAPTDPYTVQLLEAIPGHARDAVSV